MSVQSNREQAAHLIREALHGFAEAVDKGDVLLAEANVRKAIAISTAYPSVIEDQAEQR